MYIHGMRGSFTARLLPNQFKLASHVVASNSREGLREGTMRRGLALSLVFAINVEGFLPAPGVNTFTGRSVSYRTGVSNGRTLSAGVQRRSAETMVADGGKVLVSGFLNSKERTDQFVFDILQAQGKWEKIVAFSENMVFAKKRLVSRKSRYSGLLDVLEFVEGDKYDAATMDEKLQGVSAWLCFDCEADKIKDSVGFAKKAGVKSMVISSTVSAADAESAGVEDALKICLYVGRSAAPNPYNFIAALVL